MLIFNGNKLDYVIFPNNERAIKLDRLEDSMRYETNYVELKYESDLDILDLELLKRWYDEVTDKPLTLYLPYIPYSRMDRTKGKYVFSLKYICDKINSLNFHNVVVRDAHSDVSLALLDRVKHDEVVESYLEDVLPRIETDNPLYVVIADLGASKRFTEIAKGDIKGVEGVIIMDKVRDFSTGQISKIVPTNREVIKHNKFDILIVDDLCSFGGTFIGTHEALKPLGCEKANLFVTHCEENIFKGKVLESFEKVFTTDSILRRNKVDTDKIEFIDVYTL